MRFCPLNRCPHYSTSTIFPRKCYYEAQCWRGYLDMIVSILLPSWKGGWEK